MKIKIEINVEDDKKFTQAAFILDQKELLNNITQIRKCWHLNKRLIPLNQFDEWYSQAHYEFDLTPEAARYWDDAKNKLPDFSFTTSDPPIDEALVYKIVESEPMTLEIEYLLQKNGLSSSFDKLIMKAIVCGRIDQDDWNDSIDNKSKFYHENWIFKIKNYSKLFTGDTKPNIRRDREWYWANKDGKTQLEIAEKTPHRSKFIDPEDYIENVKKGIQRYASFLKVKGHL